MRAFSEPESNASDANLNGSIPTVAIGSAGDLGSRAIYSGGEDTGCQGIETQTVLTRRSLDH